MSRDVSNEQEKTRAFFMLVLLKLAVRYTKLNEKLTVGFECIIFLCDHQFKVLDLS